MKSDVNKWNLIDFSKLEAPLLASLSNHERQVLYEKATQIFTTTKSDELEDKCTYIVNGLKNEKIGSSVSSIPLKYEMIIFAAFVIFFGLLALLVIPFTMLFFYSLYHDDFADCVIYAILYWLFMITHPISIFGESNVDLFKNKLLFMALQYFSYVQVINEECFKYIKQHSKKENNERKFSTINISYSKNLEIKHNKPLLFASMPHGYFPYSSAITYLLLTDLTSVVLTVTSLMFYLPILSTIMHLCGAKTVCKSSLLKILKDNKHAYIVWEGIKGMFVNNNNDTETICLKNSKGLSKLALQTGSHIVPIYTFGNIQLSKSIFDPFGILKRISRTFKIPLVVGIGRFSLPVPIPRRIALYTVIGKPIWNKYTNNSVHNPTQQQIDEYHTLVLNKIKQLFDQHKSIYGWSHKQLVFE